MRNPGNETVDLAITDCHPGLVPGSTAISAQRLEAECDGEVMPLRVVALDQILFPVSRPFLDSLFAGDRGFHSVDYLEPDETLDLITRGESIDDAFAMLHDATHEIRGYADIKGAIEAAGKHVDARLAFPHASRSAQPWMPEQVRHDGFYRHLGLVLGSTVVLIDEPEAASG